MSATVKGQFRTDNLNHDMNFSSCKSNLQPRLVYIMIILCDIEQYLTIFKVLLKTLRQSASDDIMEWELNTILHNANSAAVLPKIAWNKDAAYI